MLDTPERRLIALEPFEERRDGVGVAAQSHPHAESVVADVARERAREAPHRRPEPDALDPPAHPSWQTRAQFPATPFARWAAKKVRSEQEWMCAGSVSGGSGRCRT